MPRPDYRSSLMNDMRAPAFLAGAVSAEANDPLPALMRELIDEIRGLRNDLRTEVLQREVAKLPKPIREAK